MSKSTMSAREAAPLMQYSALGVLLSGMFERLGDGDDNDEAVAP